jgi:dTDP-glucose pyrophosphorylase
LIHQPITQAVILAAGRGTRLGPLTADLPKPMIPLAGKPLLEHLLDRLCAAGVRRALLVTGYRAEAIESHFAHFAIPVDFIRQTEINGTARAALLAREWAGPDPFFLTFGDILAEPADYAGALAAAIGADAVVGCKWVDDPHQGAAVYVDEQGFVTRIVEKPPPGTSATNWNSAGLYCFGPDGFEEFARVPLSTRGEYEITSAIEAQIATGRRLRLYSIGGAWRDVGRPEDIAIAERMVV